MKTRILIYGATGYMGRLIAERAAKAALPIVLAGRNADKLAEMAEPLGLQYRAFSLETPSERAERLKRRLGNAEPAPQDKLIQAALGDIGVVLNAAGPFGETAEPLARACARTKTHYLDIGGEDAVLSAIKTLPSEKAILPGVGFTVLGSSLLVQEALTMAKEAGMGDPHVVRVALSRLPSISRGSAKTMLESVREGVQIQEAGKSTTSPIGRLVRSFNFGAEDDFERNEARICTALTLADVSTVGPVVEQVWKRLAHVSVSVPNVETYVEASPMEVLSYEVAGQFSLALRQWPLEGALDRLVNLWPEGPLLEERNASRQQIYVEVEDRYRRSVQARLSTPNSYDFTAIVAVEVAKRLGSAVLNLASSTYTSLTDDNERAKQMRDDYEMFALEDLKSKLPGCRVSIAYHGTKSKPKYEPEWA